jgi:hypothetical protein
LENGNLNSQQKKKILRNIFIGEGKGEERLLTYLKQRLGRGVRDKYQSA